MQKNKRKLLNDSHYLLGVRFDAWVRLLVQNGFHIRRGSILQALYITLTSLILLPFAIIEALIFAIPIHRQHVQRGPVYIMGHWRSGTTYLQDLMSRDSQFGWFDPVSTITFSNSLLLGWLLGRIQEKRLPGGRPMDNMVYQLDSPMEEVFAQATISPHAIIQMISFPRRYREYVKSAYVVDLSPRAQRQWWRSYMYIIRKLNYIKRGRTLLLKSPDNTSRAALLLRRFPNAKFINIYRDPYVVVMSTINMFAKQMERLSLNDPQVDDFQAAMEDTIIGIFERMYTEFFELERTLPPNTVVDVRYEDFVSDPEAGLRRIYSALELPGFEQALPEFRRVIEARKGYVRNRFTLTPGLRAKINARLGFYFEHYGYQMQTGDDE